MQLLSLSPVAPALAAEPDGTRQLQTIIDNATGWHVGIVPDRAGAHLLAFSGPSAASFANEPVRGNLYTLTAQRVMDSFATRCAGALVG